MPQGTATRARASTAKNGRAGGVLVDASGLPFRPAMVDLKRLTVDIYQRPLKESFVRKIIKDFKPALVGTLTISERRRGRDVIIDGQSRRAAMASNELGIATWLAVVYSGLTLKEEAQLFLDIQTKRRGMVSFDKWVAALVAEDEVALGTKAIVEGIGYKVGPTTSAKAATLSSSATLMKCYRRDEVALGRALVVFKDAWKRRHAPTGWQIEGMVRWFRDNPGADDEKMARRVGLVTPRELEELASMAKAVGGLGSKGEVYMAKAIDGKYRAREPRAK